MISDLSTKQLSIQCRYLNTENKCASSRYILINLEKKNTRESQIAEVADDR